MHTVDGAIRGEPPLSRSIHDVGGLLFCVWSDDPVAKSAGERLTDGFHLWKTAERVEVHAPIVTVIPSTCVAHRYVFLTPVRFAL
jgi:hypothetical protein